MIILEKYFKINDPKRIISLINKFSARRIISEQILIQAYIKVILISVI
jgi:hypothetical protein